MSFSIKDELDTNLDILFIYPVGHLESEADCIAMRDGWIATLGRFPRDVAIISVMDMFSVAPNVLQHYLNYVREISRHFHGYAVVVNFSASDSRAVLRSMDARAGECVFAGSVGEAIAMIQAARKSAMAS